VITVTISINGEAIFTRSAKRVGNGSVDKYITDAGDEIKHKYSNGAIKLAKKMLDTINEKMDKKSASGIGK